jgi:hypothetical protein
MTASVNRKVGKGTQKGEKYMKEITERKKVVRDADEK